MGHFKLRLVPQSPIPRDLNLGIRMRRLEPGEEGRGRRTFGPPCIPAWDAWTVLTDPDPIVYGSPFSYYIWPSSGSVLCDGDCLEWAAQWSGCPGADPSYTLTAGEDCVGVVVAVDDTAEAVEGCTLTLTAMLNGSSFGPPLELVIGDACVISCAGYTGGGTFPEFLDSVTPYTINFAIDGNWCSFGGTFTYDVSTAGPPMNHAISGTPDAIALELTVDSGQEGTSLAGYFATVQPMIDAGAGPEAFCDPITFYCEV